MATKHMITYLPSLVIRKIQMKITMSHTRKRTSEADSKVCVLNYYAIEGSERRVVFSLCKPYNSFLRSINAVILMMRKQRQCLGELTSTQHGCQ